MKPFDTQLFIKTVCAVLLSWLLSTTPGVAEKFRVVDNSMGLCNNSVNAICQDGKGFVWMGTAGGLCRYDGLSFSTFLHRSSDSTSLADNNIHCLLPMKDGLWVASNSALQFYSFNSGRFYRARAWVGGRLDDMTEQQNAMVEAGGHILTADHKGRCFVKKDGDTYFTALPHRLYTLCKISEQAVVGIGRGEALMLSADGRRVMSRCRIDFTPTLRCSASYSKMTRLVYVGNGIGHKSLALAIDKGRLRLADAPVPDNLMATTDSRGAVVFGIDGGGIIMQRGGDMQQFSPANSNLSNDAVYALMSDSNGNLWVGTYRGGVNFLPVHNERFELLARKNGAIPYDIVTAVVRDGDRLYMGLDGGGLCFYNLSSRSSYTLNTANSNLPGNNVISIVNDGRSLWMAIYTKGLVEYSPSTGAFTQYPMPTKETTGNNVWVVCDDGRGRIWVGGPNLAVFDKQSRRFLATPETFRKMECSALQDDGRHIWVGTNHRGIYKIDKRTLRVAAHYTADFGQVRLPGNEVRYLRLDSHGRVWFAVTQNGTYCLDEKAHKTIHYGEKQGLTNGDLMTLVEDAQGILWMGTANGLFKFDPRKQTFVRFGSDEDIPNTFTYGTGLLAGGTIYMGSTKGLLMFKPSKVFYQQPYRGASLLSLDLLNGSGEHFNLYGDSIRSVELKHHQNFFTIHFAVPDYESPHRVQFSCRLEGLENRWRELGDKREAAYTNVPPGHYTFHVRCTDVNGQWDRATELDVVITPPWYATWWAYLLWALLLAGVVYAALWLYLHELDVKHRIQIVDVQRSTMQKLNEAKMNFYTRITHELRTPVFLIGAQIEELKEQKQSPVTVPGSFLDSMYRNSQKLNNLISRIIDIRKLEASETKLNLQHKDVVEFCRNLTEDYHNLCAQKRISYAFRTTNAPIELDFDLDKLETILTNLVSNAFKYTREGGNVELAIADESDRVVFSVTDNGIGILEKMHETIFQNFFRTERGERQNRGDGIGLSTVKELVELHGGSIRVESEVEKGARFVFHISKGLSGEAQTAVDETGETGRQTLRIANPTAPHTILVIDDEHDTVELLERNLAADFKVIKAYDGRQGLEEAARTLPDIIVCDLMMPNMDGMEFLHTLKSDKKLAHIKVIIFTAKTSEEDMIEAFDQGADAYLTKPISLRLLRKRIDRLVAQSNTAELTASIAQTKNTYTKEEQIFLLRCREVIDDNLRNENFNIDYIADSLAMSHSSLYKKIKAMTGMSLIEFINDYKIYKAVELFNRGATNIDTVREQCGFKDAKNFREMFKRKMNVTPKQYVQNL